MPAVAWDGRPPVLGLVALARGSRSLPPSGSWHAHAFGARAESEYIMRTFVFAQHGVCFCATRGRARDLLRSGHSGPKTIADLMAAIVPRPCAVCTNPPPSGLNSLLVFTSFTGVPSAPHGTCTSWCLQAGAPEASWPRSAFPASYHQGEHKSRTPVTRFVDARSEQPSHDGVSNLGNSRLLSWRECRSS